MKDNKFEQNDKLYRASYESRNFLNSLTNQHILFPQTVSIDTWFVEKFKHAFGVSITILKNETTQKTEKCGEVYSKTLGYLSESEAIKSICAKLNSKIKETEKIFGIKINNNSTTNLKTVDEINTFLQNLRTEISKKQQS